MKDQINSLKQANQELLENQNELNNKIDALELQINLINEILFDSEEFYTLEDIKKMYTSENLEDNELNIKKSFAKI